MKPIRTERLILRPWEERDRDLFHRINSDDRVMEFFDFRRDRATADAVMDRMRTVSIRDGCGWTAAELIETGECIGCIGLHPVEIPGLAPAGAFEVGWRLAPEFWGKGYVTEAATALLDVAFESLGRDEIVSFAVLANRRSTAVMERLGMRHAGAFDHPRVPDSHLHLKRHALYRLAKEDWPSSRPVR